MGTTPPPPPPQPDGERPGGGLGAAWSAMSRGWRIASGVVGAFLALILIGALAAAGGSSGESSTVTEVVTVEADAPEPATETVTRTVTATRTVRAPQRRAAPVQRALSWSGNGSRNLGTITVPRSATLHWTNDGDIFQIWDDTFDLHVNSQASSGETAAAAGTYNDVTVNALGNWTIVIR